MRPPLIREIPCFGAALGGLLAIVVAVSPLGAIEASPIARVIPLAPAAYAGSSVNVTANVRASLVTSGTTQYAAFYDAEGYLVLARRNLGSDTWETRRTDHRGHVADAHNAISLAVDGAGFLHVAWDHHNSPLHYARALTAGSLELAAPTAMTGEREAHVTYPQFHLLPGGDLLFLYRDGGSGNGALVLNRYATATGKWTIVQPNLIDGEEKRSPYWDLCVDGAGTLHLSWNWRDTPDVATNHDLAYARSRDGGQTWTTVAGTALALPITAATTDYAARIPVGRNLMNPPAVGADAKGRPYLCAYWSPTPDAAPQFQILQHDGQAWRTIPGPARTDAFCLAGAGTKHPPISRAALLVDTTWNHLALHLIYRDDMRGSHVVLATRAGYEPGEWQLTDLTTEPVTGWEPTIDPVLWSRFTQAHLLLQRVNQRDGDDLSSTPEASPIATLVWSAATSVMRAHAQPPVASSVRPTGMAVPLERGAVLALAQRVADWQWTQFPSVKHHPRDWTVAPFYIGTLALDRVSPDHRNRDRMLRQAEAIGWQPHERLYHADDHCVIQAYLELHHDLGEPRMLAPSQARFDQVLAHPTNARFDWGTPNCGELWSWCDALFMAPMSWLEMWRETGDRRYLDFMNHEWWRTTDRLYRSEIGFYFRDESYLDLREPNGKTIHWSRGNGWVFAGLARVLSLFPKDHPDYPRYEKLYREMAAAVLAAQQPDGLWRVGLLDPVAHPAPETSGSSFYAFGLAWGVNHDLLDRAAATPAIERAWTSLAASVTAEGRLENVQPIGAAPEGFDPHHSDVFAVGAFLLAASEVAGLGR